MANEKLEKKVEIDLTNGTKKFLADLTPADLASIKLTEKDGKSYLSMKSEVIGQTPTHVTERRLYKWNVMSTLVMYDVKYGRTLDVLRKELTDGVVYAHATRDFIIAQDKLHNGIQTTKKPGDQKIMDEATKLGLPPEELAKIKAIMMTAGFGK
jgi:hypothetical protein